MSGEYGNIDCHSLQTLSAIEMTKTFSIRQRRQMLFILYGENQTTITCRLWD